MKFEGRMTTFFLNLLFHYVFRFLSVKFLLALFVASVVKIHSHCFLPAQSE
jgi:hypothetical protein